MDEWNRTIWRRRAWSVAGILAALALAWGLNAVPTVDAQAVLGEMCVQTSTGGLIISPGADRSHRAPDGTMVIEHTPSRVQFVEGFRGETLVCRDTATGTRCRTLDDLFAGVR